MTYATWEVVDPSNLSDADWAELNRLQEIHTNSGPEVSGVAFDELTERNPLQSIRILLALSPTGTMEAFKDVLASKGMTHQDLIEAIRNMESPARDQ